MTKDTICTECGASRSCKLVSFAEYKDIKKQFGLVGYTPPKDTTQEVMEEEFRKQYDELGLKPKKPSMGGLEREIIIDYWRKALTTIADKARSEEKKRWLAGNVCHSCGEDIKDSTGLTDTCGDCFSNE